MDITRIKTITANKYTTEFKTSFTTNEVQLINKYGDPRINVGGTFTGPPAFTLPDKYRDLKAGFPYTYYMDKNDDVLAEDKMTVWGNEVKQRMTDAIVALRANVDTFTDEIIDPV